MFRRIGRAFKEAFWGITHHFAMVSSTANAVTLTLILVGAMTLVIGNVQSISYDVEKSIQLYVTVESSFPEENIGVIEEKIKQTPGVYTVKYSDSDSELDSFIESFGQDGSIFEAYRGENNPLPRAFIVSVTNGYKMSNVSAAIEKIEGISKADYGNSTVEEFRTLLSGVRNVGYVISIALAALAIFLIHNTIRITIDSRKEEIGIMRLVGATNSYIRFPLLLEGMFIGLIGSIIPILLVIFGYKYIYEAFNGQLISGMLKMVPVFPYTIYVSVFVVGIGILVGLIGSLISTNKYLRWKR